MFVTTLIKMAKVVIKQFTSQKRKIDHIDVTPDASAALSGTSSTHEYDSPRPAKRVRWADSDVPVESVRIRATPSKKGPSAARSQKRNVSRHSSTPELHWSKHSVVVSTAPLGHSPSLISENDPKNRGRQDPNDKPAIAASASPVNETASVPSAPKSEARQNSGKAKRPRSASYSISLQDMNSTSPVVSGEDTLDVFNSHPSVSFRPSKRRRSYNAESQINERKSQKENPIESTSTNSSDSQGIGEPGPHINSPQHHARPADPPTTRGRNRGTKRRHEAAEDNTSTEEPERAQSPFPPIEGHQTFAAAQSELPKPEPSALRYTSNLPIVMRKGSSLRRTWSTTASSTFTTLPKVTPTPPNNLMVSDTRRSTRDGTSRRHWPTERERRDKLLEQIEKLRREQFERALPPARAKKVYRPCDFSWMGEPQLQKVLWAFLGGELEETGLSGPQLTPQARGSDREDLENFLEFTERFASFRARPADYRLTSSCPPKSSGHRFTCRLDPRPEMESIARAESVLNYWREKAAVGRIDYARLVTWPKLVSRLDPLTQSGSPCLQNLLTLYHSSFTEGRNDPTGFKAGLSFLQAYDQWCYEALMEDELVLDYFFQTVEVKALELLGPFLLANNRTFRANCCEAIFRISIMGESGTGTSDELWRLALGEVRFPEPRLASGISNIPSIAQAFQRALLAVATVEYQKVQQQNWYTMHNSNLSPPFTTINVAVGLNGSTQHVNGSESAQNVGHLPQTIGGGFTPYVPPFVPTSMNQPVAGPLSTGTLSNTDKTKMRTGYNDNSGQPSQSDMTASIRPPVNSTTAQPNEGINNTWNPSDGQMSSHVAADGPGSPRNDKKLLAQALPSVLPQKGVADGAGASAAALQVGPTASILETPPNALKNQGETDSAVPNEPYGKHPAKNSHSEQEPQQDMKIAYSSATPGPAPPLAKQESKSSKKDTNEQQQITDPSTEAPVKPNNELENSSTLDALQINILPESRRATTKVTGVSEPARSLPSGFSLAPEGNHPDELSGRISRQEVDDVSSTQKNDDVLTSWTSKVAGEQRGKTPVTQTPEELHIRQPAPSASNLIPDLGTEETPLVFNEESLVDRNSASNSVEQPNADEVVKDGKGGPAQLDSTQYAPSVPHDTAAITGLGIVSRITSTRLEIPASSVTDIFEDSAKLDRVPEQLPAETESGGQPLPAGKDNERIEKSSKKTDRAQEETGRGNVPEVGDAIRSGCQVIQDVVGQTQIVVLTRTENGLDTSEQDSRAELAQVAESTHQRLIPTASTSYPAATTDSKDCTANPVQDVASANTSNRGRLGPVESKVAVGLPEPEPVAEDDPTQPDREPLGKHTLKVEQEASRTASSEERYGGDGTGTLTCGSSWRAAASVPLPSQKSITTAFLLEEDDKAKGHPKPVLQEKLHADSSPTKSRENVFREMSPTTETGADADDTRKTAPRDEAPRDEVQDKVPALQDAHVVKNSVEGTQAPLEPEQMKPEKQDKPVSDKDAGPSVLGEDAPKADEPMYLSLDTEGIETPFGENQVKSESDVHRSSGNRTDSDAATSIKNLVQNQQEQIDEEIAPPLGIPEARRHASVTRTMAHLNEQHPAVSHPQSAGELTMDTDGTTHRTGNRQTNGLHESESESNMDTLPTPELPSDTDNNHSMKTDMPGPVNDAYPTAPNPGVMDETDRQRSSLKGKGPAESTRPPQPDASRSLRPPVILNRPPRVRPELQSASTHTPTTHHVRSGSLDLRRGSSASPNSRASPSTSMAITSTEEHERPIPHVTIHNIGHLVQDQQREKDRQKKGKRSGPTEAEMLAAIMKELAITKELAMSDKHESKR